jgi:hypothetical protein
MFIPLLRDWSRSKRPSEPYIQDPAFIAVESVSLVMGSLIAYLNYSKQVDPAAYYVMTMSLMT